MYTWWQRVGSELINFRYGPESDYYDLTPAPDLAESWEVSADGLTYTFHLRKGVKWQDKPPVNGREVVASDVKFTFDRLFKVAKTLYGYQLGDLKSVEAPDNYTLKFTLGSVYAPFLTHLGNFWGVILPPECEEKIVGGFDKVEAIIGTGPFMLDSYQPNVAAVFKRNPTYFRSPLPYLDEVRETIVADKSTREAAMRAGNLDILGVDATSLQSLQKTNPELQLLTREGTLQGWAIAMRSDKPPFNDVRVRQAVALAIDRQTWVKSLQLGLGLVDNGPIPAGMKVWKLPTDQLGEGAKYFRYDPQEAKRLLAEAGYPNGFETTYTTHSPATYGDATDLIADYLSKVGIKVTIKVMDYPAWLASVAAGFGTTYEGMTISTQWTILDPDLTIWGFYYPGQATNISCTNDPKLNAMMEEQRRLMDYKERKKVVDDIQRYLSVQNYCISAPYPWSLILVQPWVRDYYPKVWGDRGRIWELIWLDKK
jgi:peptide/nickel transport system substrate-binding protein